MIEARQNQLELNAIGVGQDWGSAGLNPGRIAVE